jgi:hypothetical protein
MIQPLLHDIDKSEWPRSQNNEEAEEELYKAKALYPSADSDIGQL